MIDWERSAELNGMGEDELQARFVQFPKSNKRVIAICDIYGKERNVKYFRYYDLCHKCAHGTPEHRSANSARCIARFSDPAEREAARLRAVNQFSDPKARETARANMLEVWAGQEYHDAQSIAHVQYHLDHPEAIEEARSRGTVQFSTQKSRDEMSETMKDSATHKASVEKQTGGMDTVSHHMIYDHSDLSRNVMHMTRSTHTQLHRLFQKNGIEIPHIRGC